MSDADPSTQRIISVELDEGSIVWRNPDVEQERRVAIFDLIEDNKFVPQRGHEDGYAGPYRLMLRVEEGRLIFEISREDGSPLEAIILGDRKEHTSELQSLMRIPYAVFCLQTKKNH